MDKDIKRKSQQIWRNRLVVSFSLIGVLGVSLWQLQVVFKYHPQQTSCSPELFKLVEDVTNESKSAEEKKQALTEIQNIAQKHNLPWTKKLVENWEQDWVLYRMQNPELLRELFVLSMKHMFLQSVILLAISLLILSALLFALSRLPISSNLHLHAFLPEECVAELGILIKRMKKKNASPWEIRLRLMTELLYLFWALYIQIQLENLWLPSEDHEIDE